MTAALSLLHLQGVAAGQHFDYAPPGNDMLPPHDKVPFREKAGCLKLMSDCNDHDSSNWHVVSRSPMFGTIGVLFMVQWQEWAIGPASFSTLIGLMAACRSDPYADVSISCTCNRPHCCCLTNFCSPTTIYNHYTIFLRCAASYAAGQRYASSAS